MGDLTAFYQTCACPDCTTERLAAETLAVKDLTGLQKAFTDWLQKIHDIAADGNNPIADDTLAEVLDTELANLIRQHLAEPIVSNDLADVMDKAMLNTLKSNVNVFSYAKTLKELQAINELLLDDTGNLRSFAAFKKEAKTIYSTYNQDWLRAEYNHAVASATSAARWHEFQAEKDVMHSLEYSTVGDERVRQTHKLLDGIIRPIDDDLWKTHYPPNGWNCRCRTLQSDGEATDLKDKDLPALKAMFNGNVALDGIMFPDNHPYFEELTKAQLKTITQLGTAE
jgi:SPP1 gp7 family putative phage head morphogenesis protein